MNATQSVPIVGAQTTRKCVGGPWDGRSVSMPATARHMGATVPCEPGMATCRDTSEIPVLAGDIKIVTYELCVLGFPKGRVVVWHPAGTEIGATVARLATGYVPETDLRLILTKVAMLERDNESLRQALASFERQPSFDAAMTQAP